MNRILILSVLLFLLGGTSLYVAHRLFRGLSCFWEGLKLWPVFTVILLLVLFVVLGFLRSMLSVSRSIKDIFAWVGGYGMGVLLYLLVFTLMADLLLCLPRLLKLSFTAHPLYHGFVTCGVLLLTVAVCLWGFIGGRQIDHVTYEISLEDKQDISDLKIALISDVHLGALGSEEHLERIVEELNGLKPDVICIAGDFFDTDFHSISDPEKALEILRKLQASYGVYACLGNHDGGSTYGKMLDFLKAADIRLLDDAYTVIDDRLILAGRLDTNPIGGYGGGRRKDFSQMADWQDPTMPVVVMDHNPANIDEYSGNVDLVLCGHTHKGQVFPGNLITKGLYTVDHGYYRKDAQSPQVIVTSGVGSWGMPMRVGSDCEIVLIRFSVD